MLQVELGGPHQHDPIISPAKMRLLSSSSLLAFALVSLSFQSAHSIRHVEVVSPLQSLTIPDPEIRQHATTKRQRFLERFRVGVAAEAEARKEVAAAETQNLQSQSTSASDLALADWSDAAAAREREMLSNKEAYVEGKFEAAVAAFDAENPEIKASDIKRSTNSKYQFVGVVNPPTKSKRKSKPISWYARPKPKDATWSVRLVHQNREAIIKDLFNRGKVDIFATYENQGIVVKSDNNNFESGEAGGSTVSRKPKVTAKYSVQKRSWKNLWKFSPLDFFTDSSGMYWRERRLQPGMYTDGEHVYEATYRYRDGRNGMHRRSTLDQALQSKAFSEKQKKRILERLEGDVPDVVLED